MSLSDNCRPDFRAVLCSAVGFGLIAASGVARAGVYTDDFSGGISPTYWNTVITTPNLYSIDDTHGDVRFAKNPAVNSPGGFQNVRIALKLSAIGGNVSGDFSGQVTFRDAQITGPEFNQVQFEAFFADGSTVIDVFDNYGSPTIGINAHLWDGFNILGAKALPTDTTDGVLRIGRVGSVLTAYFDDQPIYSLNKTSALTTLRLNLQNNHNNDYIAVTFDDFSLTAASVVPEPSISATLLPLGVLGLRRRQ